MFEAMAALNPVAMLANAGTQLGASYINARQQDKTNERAEQNAWGMFNAEKELANTAHQRNVADLKNAGLNPILSTHGSGSASPGGSAPALTAPKIEMPDVFPNFVSLKQLDQVDKQIEQGDKKIQIDAMNALTNNEYTRAQTKTEKYGPKGIMSRFLEKMMNDSGTADYTLDNINKALQKHIQQMKQNARTPRLAPQKPLTIPRR